jgi:hypothetical protein
MPKVKLGPMGLLPTVELPEQQKIVANLKKADAIDISKVVNVVRLTRAQHIPTEETHTVIRDLKRFLALHVLVQDPDYDFVPAGKIDLAWHEFILHTQLYMDFCAALGCGYIHHNPEETRAHSRAKASGEPFFYTKHQLTKHFGAMPPFIWGIPAACDTSSICNSNLHPCD